MPDSTINPMPNGPVTVLVAYKMTAVIASADRIIRSVDPMFFFIRLLVGYVPGN